MHRNFWALLSVATVCATLGAQNIAKRPQFTQRGVVQHGTNVATVLANHPRPLFQALLAVSEEYGWVVNYEDPPYSSYDVVDDTDPQWRAGHPNAKGVTRPAGGEFRTTFTEGPNTLSPSAQEKKRILNKILSDYNQSANPGKFVMREHGDGTFAIVGDHVRNGAGTVVSTGVFLDTPISVVAGTRDALATINLIIKALTVRTGVKIIPGKMAGNALRQTKATVGGDNVPARTFLLQTLAGTRHRMVWYFLYDADAQIYALNVIPAQRAYLDTFGNRILVPIDR